MISRSLSMLRRMTPARFIMTNHSISKTWPTGMLVAGMELKVARTAM